MSPKLKGIIFFLCAISISSSAFLSTNILDKIEEIKKEKVIKDKNKILGKWKELNVQKSTAINLEIKKSDVFYNNTRIGYSFDGEFLKFKKGDIKFNCQLKKINNTLSCVQIDVYRPDFDNPYKPLFVKIEKKKVKIR